VVGSDVGLHPDAALPRGGAGEARRPGIFGKCDLTAETLLGTMVVIVYIKHTYIYIYITYIYIFIYLTLCNTYIIYNITYMGRDVQSCMILIGNDWVSFSC
jgi:hypothetical protein